ncbi:MAG: APC family permease [Chloroflexi bacterium]|nr:APC family permease [Chloroflexota bacterium]
MPSSDDQEQQHAGASEPRSDGSAGHRADQQGDQPGEPDRQPDASVHPELEWKEELRGSKPGTRYVRLVRPHHHEFKRRAPGRLIATERVLQPRGLLGRVAESLRLTMVGRRLPTELEIQERTDKIKGLAIFASDNMSSSAYATEEVMRVLVLASAGALALTMPITTAIVFVLAVVVISYLQVIRAYPRGGGSYAVAHENLGSWAGLTAAAALITDYMLTVAVSTSAGVAAMTSAFPALFPYRVLIAVVVVAIVTVMNLRGIRESGAVFALPTYLYLLSVLGLLAMGIFRVVTGTLPTSDPSQALVERQMVEPLTIFLVLRAFASGSVALTGVEAVSDGVAAFKPPEVRNAQIVLLAMGTLFATIFLGISFISGQMTIVPSADETETVLSQLTRLLVDTSWYYYAVQFATAFVLILAANTAFNGFPRLAVILAEDRYLPSQFQFRGDRLAYTAGITILALISGLVIVIYDASVTGLIPLYTVGVFLAFTLSQAGMVLRWFRLRSTERGWRWRSAVNAVGASATGVVLIVVAATKFALGAWMVLLLIPILIGMMWATNRHYRKFAAALSLENKEVRIPPPVEPNVVVPISRLDRAALQALTYAKSISSHVSAVHITDDPQEAEQFREKWENWRTGMPLVIVESPYRALVPPLLAYIDAVHRQDPRRSITVVICQAIPKHFWEFILHNQTALWLNILLFFRPDTVVTNVTYRAGSPDEDLDATRRESNTAGT